MLRKPELPDGFQRTVFIGRIWGEGCRVCDFLPDWLVVLTGQCSRNSVFSLKLLSSNWVPAEEVTDNYYVYSLGRNQYPGLIAALLFLDCFSFVSAFPYFSD